MRAMSYCLLGSLASVEQDTFPVKIKIDDDDTIVAMATTKGEVNEEQDLAQAQLQKSWFAWCVDNKRCK